MQVMRITNNYLKARYLLFKWRYNLAIGKKIALSFVAAGVVGLAAQTKISLPWTPVPVTLQTLVVLLSGVLLGRAWGGISQGIYLGLGVAGVSWFSNWGGGFGALIGPTGGYLVGFVLAALFLGHFTDKYIRARSFLPMLGLMLFANFGLIHIPGLLQLGVWSYFIKGTFPTLWQLLLMGTIPFVIGDITKIAIAAALATTITPKESYNGEADTQKIKKWRIF